MTLANKLTLSRILLVVPFIVLLSIGGKTQTLIALIIYAIATLTDFFDGRIARKRNEVSDLGKYMDPLADKIFVTAALVILVGTPKANLPAWPVVIILSRDLIIGVLRSLAASKGKVIGADKIGKFKTAFQMVAIFLALLILSFEIDSMTGYIYYLILISALITFYSGFNYIRENWALFRE